ncbi:MAG TPA: response regulator [bacterium]|nr:response regulator [bacterium]
MASPKNLRVLLVDDEEIVHVTIGGYLRDCGHAVDDAAAADEALARLTRGDYDLALVDLQMPDMDGFTLLARMREQGHRLPVILMSGHGSDELKEQALRQGAAVFMHKPIKLRELDQAIAQSCPDHDAPAHSRDNPAG